MMTHHQNRLLLRLLFLSGMLLPWAPGLAAAADVWRATAVQGDASVQQGEAVPVPLGQGQAIEPGQRLATGAGGRVVLARGASTITVGPDGRMEIPAGGDDGVRTKIVQAMGSLLFKVEKRASQHFEVETPYLAAVVKGTTFTVSVDGETSAVHVVEGAVEVKALATGQVGLIKPGYTAVVSQRGGRGLSIIGGKPEASGKAGQRAQTDELNGEAEEADQAGGRTSAPGQVKRLHAMLGQTTVDVAATSKGFVRNAGLANGHADGAGAASTSPGSGNGKAVANGLSKDKSNSGKSAGVAKASAGNPGGGKALGVTKVSPAVANTVAKTNKAADKLLAASVKAKEKALKKKTKVGGEIGDDDEEDDDDD